MSMINSPPDEKHSSPLVSVVITAYGVAQYIEEAVESVLAQTLSDYEIIVVNDGSPDTNELELALDKYRDRIVYLKQENKGVSAARNTGIRAARGSLIALLDGDDAFEPEYLSNQVRFFEDDPTVDVVYSDAWLFGDSLKDGQRFMDYCPSEGEVSFESLMNEKCTVMLSTSTVRRETLYDVGMFDEALRYTEDFDLWLRILKNGGRITYHRKALVRRRVRSESTSASDPVWLCQHILATLNRIGDTWDLTRSERASLQQRLRFQTAMLHQFKGKNAFFNGDNKTAIRELREANRFFQKPKLKLVLLLLRFAPRLLLSLHDARDQVRYKTRSS